MRLAHIAFTLLLFGATAVNAQTVVSGANLELLSPNNSFPGENFSFTVWQDAAATDPTTIWLNYDGSHVSFGGTNVDEESDWYLVHPGDHFGKTAIQAGAYPTIWGFPVPSVNANVGSSDFYLGVSTGQGYDYVPELGGNKGHRTAFGWVHLQPVAPGSTTLVMLGNVMSYDSPGIIVGTTTLVPEPTTAAFLALAGFVGATRRRVRRVPKSLALQCSQVRL